VSGEDGVPASPDPTTIARRQRRPYREKRVTFAYFATFHDHARPELRITPAELAGVLGVVAATPGLRRGLVFTPEATRDPYATIHDGPSPQLALELYFERIDQLERALAQTGHLQLLAKPDSLPSLAAADVTQQAMVARPFPVPDPVFKAEPGSLPCTYLVHYLGEADDLNLWTDYYLSHHPQVMARFPGIREIEVCTRLDWCGFLPWRRVDYMQRNKVVFDSAAALTAALSSPVRQEMRADYQQFPPFTGDNAHFPVATREIRPAA
jgi:hypothetical protein